MNDESTVLKHFADAVLAEAEGLISNQPDPKGRAAVGVRLKELALAAITRADAGTGESETAEPTQKTKSEKSKPNGGQE